jgi:hypothetical protein
MDTRTFGDLIRASQVVTCFSAIRKPGLFGFPVHGLEDDPGITGHRWVLCETVGGWCWVRHDKLVELFPRRTTPAPPPHKPHTRPPRSQTEIREDLRARPQPEHTRPGTGMMKVTTP